MVNLEVVVEQVVTELAQGFLFPQELLILLL